METESHAVTHVKNEGIGAISCIRGPGLFSVWARLVVFVLSYPPPHFLVIYFFYLSYHSFHSPLASKAEIHQKIIVKNKNEGAKFLMNIKFSLYTVAQYLSTKGNSNSMRLKLGVCLVAHRPNSTLGFQADFTLHRKKLCSRNFRIYTISHSVIIHWTVPIESVRGLEDRTEAFQHATDGEGGQFHVVFYMLSTQGDTVISIHCSRRGNTKRFRTKI